MNIQLNLNTGPMQICLDGDFYGEQYWRRVESRRYEPDTIGFIEDRTNSNSVFMDIGAANGAMTLIAAQKGAIVHSYEPDPAIYKVLDKNVELNSSFTSKVHLHKYALSNQNGEMDFRSGSNKKVLSDIIFNGDSEYRNSKIQIKSIVDEIDLVHSNAKAQLVIKMDIEGAEWKILSDPKVIQKLSQHSAIMLLAVHPGFYRPFKKIAPGLNRISMEVWRIRNYRESLKLFKLLAKFGNVYRTNLNPINSARILALLSILGYHEYVIDFQEGLK